MVRVILLPRAAANHHVQRTPLHDIRHTAAHLVDHVIPSVPVRQWVISVPKRLRGMLADRPAAVAALTKIFLDEIERLLCTMWRPLHDGQSPLPLYENAMTNPWPQPVHSARPREKPAASQSTVRLGAR